MPTPRRVRIDQVLSIGLASLCLAAAFLPWQRSGQVSRSGYALLSSAQRAGLVSGGSTKVLAVVAYLLPTVTATVIAAWMIGRRRLACALSGLVGLVTTVGAAVVLRVVHGGILFGTPLALALGIVALAVMAGRSIPGRTR